MSILTKTSQFSGLRSITIFTISVVMLSPHAVLSQEKTGSRAALNLLQDAFVSIAEELEPAVVTVTAKKTVRAKADRAAPDDSEEGIPGLPFGRSRTPRAFRSQGTGSGLIISGDGWILTNDHVIGGADKVSIKLRDGREFDGTVRRDYRSDLALVKISASDLHAARLGNSDNCKIGQWAIAIGSPYRYEGSFSVGVVSSMFRRQEISSAAGLRIYPSMIQTDAAINPGNSGGPLVNIDGEVIGINTAIESEGGGSVGIGFAIPVNTAKYVIDELKNKGRVTYGYLGVNPNTITPTLAAAYKVSDGALIYESPLSGSPADKAGLEVGDVVTEIDGKAVHNELDLRSTVSRIRPGTVVTVSLVRNGMEKHVKAKIEEAPNLVETVKPETPEKVTFGVEVTAITPDVAKRVGLEEGAQGVVIKEIDRGSATGDSELHTSDVILKIDDTPTPTVETFNKIVGTLKPGDVVKVFWAGRRGPTTVRRVANVKMD
jgi:serine protease Do